MKLTQFLMRVGVGPTGGKGPRSRIHWFRYVGENFWKSAKKRHDRYWAHRNGRLQLQDVPPQIRFTMDENMPKLGMKNPFIKEPEPCILCKNDITVDYKNVRLLSQFVSPFTGNVLNNRATGLCFERQLEVQRAIAFARRAGLMPKKSKDSRFHGDYSIIDERRIS